DMGSIICTNRDMEEAQDGLTSVVAKILSKNMFPIVLGGGHDMAYGHYKGLKKYLSSSEKGTTIGIINFDAHFDLRSNKYGNNSGTPFYQIALDCRLNKTKFKYKCL